jgi:hypothetical protein
MHSNAPADKLVCGLAGSMLLSCCLIDKDMPDFSAVLYLANFDISSEVGAPARDTVPEGAEERLTHGQTPTDHKAIRAQSIKRCINTQMRGLSSTVMRATPCKPGRISICDPSSSHSTSK